nr:hypothetical protein [Planctomycetota bacterium]
MVARPWSSRSDGLPDAAHAVLFLGKPFLGNTNQGSPRFMGNRHDDQDATGTGHDPAADLLRDALECEVEGAWMQRRLEDGTCDESLGAEMRAQALVAFDAAAADDLLEEALGLDAAEEATAALRSGARVAALEAWDRASSGLEAAPAPLLSLTAARAERERREPLRARRMRAPFFMRPVAAAAMLLVALGAGLFLFGQGDDAEAGLQLRALSRRDLSSNVGMSQVRPGYFATLGRVFAPREDELLSFGLAHDGLVVVGAGDAVRVTRPTARVPGTAPTVLRLESGEARLATTRDAPVPLEVDGVGLLVLTEGAAHVALHAETADGAPAVALAEHSVARFHRADGTSVPLAGPTRVLLAADGVRSFGTPARSLFRELAFFGGPLPPVTQVRTVSARLFDVREGDVRRGRQDLRLLAAADGKDTAARLAWRPPLALADAR